MAKPGSRPLSPHLQIWRWGPGMLVSILHRVTGTGLALGLGILVWWLGALAGGQDAYDSFTAWVWPNLSELSWSGVDILCSLIKVLLKVVLIGLTWAFFQHLLSGLRHFVLDTGAGYELKTNNTWATILPILGVLMTAGFWAILLLR